MSDEIRKMFRGIRALYGENGFSALQNAHVLVIGVGGIGSWLAEALCRSAVGELTLLDCDKVEITNSNRQLHTTSKTVGEFKTEILRQRFLEINPFLKINVINERLTPENISEVLKDCPRYVNECIDDVEAKAYVADFLFRQGVTFICAGGAGGRTDPRHLEIGDLAQAKGDALIARMRNILRKDYGFPKGGERMNIPCTYSNEKPVYSDKEGYVSGDLPAFGASMAVTASAGLMAASWMIKQIVKDETAFWPVP